MQRSFTCLKPDELKKFVAGGLNILLEVAFPSGPSSALIATDSAMIAFGPVESHDANLNGTLLSFTLSFVDERWYVVGLELETPASLAVKSELFQMEHPEARRTISTADEPAQRD